MIMWLDYAIVVEGLTGAIWCGSKKVKERKMSPENAISIQCISFLVPPINNQNCNNEGHVELDMTLNYLYTAVMG